MSGEETVVGTSIVREAAGVFRTRHSLKAAIERLLTAGFDRSDIDVLGDIEAIYRRFGGVAVPAEELADIPDTPRRSLVTQDDRRLALIVVFQVLAVVGAFAGGAAALVAGSGIPVAIAVATVAGIVLGLIGVGMARPLLRTFDERIEDILASRGIVVWVRVHDPDQEARALEILRENGADAVRIHEIEIGKRLEDLPLAGILPDEPVNHPLH